MFLKNKFFIITVIVITASILFFSFLLKSAEIDDIIIDSAMTFEEAIAGTKAPEKVIDSLCIVDVEYYSFDDKLHRGQLVIHKKMKTDIEQIFHLIKKRKFPVKHAIPIVKYDWNDNKSMAANNTSAFCYRYIAGTKRLSNHSFGRAVDINPYNNPVIYAEGKISPEGAVYDTSKPGVFTESNPIVQEFIERGWRWGGNFNSLKDYHHFDK